MAAMVDTLLEPSNNMHPKTQKVHYNDYITPILKILNGILKYNSEHLIPNNLSI